mmetsp:Transcript_94200/g.266602  ORF Transcript_94200/g.266602 Transcript_94200/m.266602 type:complete len:232 (-) Transcript_94200:705-1400(-)
MSALHFVASSSVSSANLNISETGVFFTFSFSPCACLSNLLTSCSAALTSGVASLTFSTISVFSFLAASSRICLHRFFERLTRPSMRPSLMSCSFDVSLRVFCRSSLRARSPMSLPRPLIWARAAVTASLAASIAASISPTSLSSPARASVLTLPFSSCTAFSHLPTSASAASTSGITALTFTTTCSFFASSCRLSSACSAFLFASRCLSRSTPMVILSRAKSSNFTPLLPS